MNYGTDTILLCCDYPLKYEVTIIIIININKFNKYCLIRNYCSYVLCIKYVEYKFYVVI